MMLISTQTVKAGRRAWPPVLHRVVKTIRSRGLLEKGQHLLVAVSGGPDSVALLSLLHRLQSSWRLTLTAVHFNYGLRGAESDQDQVFVAALCRALDVPLHARRLDLSHRSRRTSLQAVARDLRYRALSSLASQRGADRIALGHTADDQAETVLLWMLRGAGLTGLSGMPVAREDAVIRPLFDITREDVLTYLRRTGLSYREDSSNAKLLYVRNQIRHEVLPVLKQRFPSSVRTLCRLADLCREDDRYLNAHVAELIAKTVRPENGGWAVDRVCVRGWPLAIQRRLVRDLLRRCDPLHKAASAQTIERILSEVVERTQALNFSVNRTRLVVKGDVIRFVPLGQDGTSSGSVPQPVAEIKAIPSQILWSGTGQTIRVEELPRDQGGRNVHTPCRIVVDADRLSKPLIVRAWRYGDRFYPAGMKGRSKKLQDYFTDLKVPAADRGTIPLVVAPEGIVWIVGYRQDERWVVTDKTRRCLQLTASGTTHREGVS